MRYGTRIKLSLQDSLVREFAGSRPRLALNTFATGTAGVLFAHYGLGVAMSLQLVLSAMLAPLGAMFIAGLLKHS